MTIDDRKCKALPDLIIINGHTVERVTAYKYLGVMVHGQTTLVTLYPI